MSDFSDDIKNYWNYYLELEDEFYQTKRYVDFSRDNYKTYSIEFLKLFQAICGEIDTLGKVLASKENPNFKPKNAKSIYHWWIEIEDAISITPEVSDYYTNTTLKTHLYDLEIKNYVLDDTVKPWENFKVIRYQNLRGGKAMKLKPNCSIPSWWSDYNKTKHVRTGLNANGEINFQKANLRNVSYSIAALYCLEISLLEIDGTDDELSAFMNKSKLFNHDEFCSNSEINKIINNDC